MTDDGLIMFTAHLAVAGGHGLDCAVFYVPTNTV